MLHSSKRIVRLRRQRIAPLADDAHQGVTEPLVVPRFHIIIAIGRTIQVGNVCVHGYRLPASRVVDLMDSDTPWCMGLFDISQAIQSDHRASIGKHQL